MYAIFHTKGTGSLLLLLLLVVLSAAVAYIIAGVRRWNDERITTNY